MQQITLFVDGERILAEVPPNTRVGDLPALIKGFPGANQYRVNGATATQQTPLKTGDRVQAIPDAGQLAN